MGFNSGFKGLICCINQETDKQLELDNTCRRTPPTAHSNLFQLLHDSGR